MARKTTESATTRRKKTTPPTEAAAAQPAPVQIVPEVPREAHTEARKNVNASNLAPKKASVQASVNLDEEIRRRAYELYLERKGAAGDPTRDWVIAEREVRARHAGPKESSLAAVQGRS